MSHGFTGPVYPSHRPVAGRCVSAVAAESRSCGFTDRGRRADAEIRGDFPGSPVTLVFAFVVDGGTIRLVPGRAQGR